jgi:hypothetical protein
MTMQRVGGFPNPLNQNWNANGYSITNINALGVNGLTSFHNQVTLDDNKSVIFGTSGNTYSIDSDSLGSGDLRFRIQSGTGNTADFQMPVKIVDGTSGGALALYFASDTDTGLYLKSANVLAIECGGADSFTVGPLNNISFKRLRAATDDSIELGSSAIRWQYVYAVNISDGTKTIPVVQLANLKTNETVEGAWILPKAGGSLGFYGTTPQTQATITGSRGGNAALANLLTALAAYGLIVDSTTA